MKILLINPPDGLDKVLGAGANLVTPYEPLGLLYIAAVCREAGHEVKVVDAYVERLGMEKVQAIIRKEAPDVVGMTTFTSNGEMVFELGKWLKKNLPEIFVVLGNIHAAVYAKGYLKEGCCDAVVHGEGERIFLEMLGVLEKGSRDFSDFNAVSWKKGEEIVLHSGWAVEADLATLPLPARDLVNQDLYDIPPVSNQPYQDSGNKKGKHMFTSRGCPNRCTFCSVHHGKRQRAADVMHVVDEMEMLAKDYNTGFIFIMDSLFISRKKRVLAICEEIRRRKLDIQWGCEGHVRFVDEELIRAMENAGCHDIAFGIESGAQHLLDRVKKTTTLPMIRQAVETVKRVSNIQIAGLFILGLPGETQADTHKTIRFATDLPLDMAQFSILVPYPGSEIYYDLAAKGEIETGMDEDGNLDPKVWRRYVQYITYTDNEPIWVTPAMTSGQLRTLQKKANRAFYFRPRFFWAQVRRIRPADVPRLFKTAFKTFF